MKIGNLNLNTDIMIIAEIGNNHEGNFDLAKEMIIEASNAGAMQLNFKQYNLKMFLLKKPKNSSIKKFQFTNNEYKTLFPQKTISCFYQRHLV